MNLIPKHYADSKLPTAQNDGMILQQEWASWKTPPTLKTSPVPSMGEKAPTSAKLELCKDGKPTVITFLRFCGCPFAEKTFTNLRNIANKHPEINFVAVSHSNQEATDKWALAVGGEWDVSLIVDPEREIYAEWGLGVSNAWHVLNPMSMYSAWRIGKQDSIWKRPTESGNVWQTSGSFAVDQAGVVRWVSVAKSADDIPDFNAAVKAVRWVVGLDVLGGSYE